MVGSHWSSGFVSVLIGVLVDGVGLLAINPLFTSCWMVSSGIKADRRMTCAVQLPNLCCPVVRFRTAVLKDWLPASSLPVLLYHLPRPLALMIPGSVFPPGAIQLMSMAVTGLTWLWEKWSHFIQASVFPNKGFPGGEVIKKLFTMEET